MKVIGLLGGMSWESSIEYERIINSEVRRRLGGSHSADLIIRSYDFEAIERLQREGAWEAAGRLLASDARRLQEAGAGLIVLCTNTMHRVADAIAAAVDVPFLHIADATGEAIVAAGIETAGLLGTRYTMEGAFYRKRLEERHGITIITPGEADRELVDEIIFSELVRGILHEESRLEVLRIIGSLTAGGAAGVIAGCTEIELLVTPDDVDVAYFPTTRLHAVAAVDLAMAESGHSST